MPLSLPYSEWVDIAVWRSTCDSMAYLIIRIEDIGNGASQDACAQIFDRIARADAGLLRTYGGAGLGLAIGREWARWMGRPLSLQKPAGNRFSAFLSIIFNDLTVMSGIDATQTIRSDVNDPPVQLPIPTATANVSDPHMSCIKGLGMSGCTSKPVSPGTSLSLIERNCAA